MRPLCPYAQKSLPDKEGFFLFNVRAAEDTEPVDRDGGSLCAARVIPFVRNSAKQAERVDLDLHIFGHDQIRAAEQAEKVDLAAVGKIRVRKVALRAAKSR